MGGCEQFTGHARDICLGVADMPLEKINRYRKKWKLEPLAEKPTGPFKVVKSNVIYHSPAATNIPKPPRATVKKRGCCGKARRQPPVSTTQTPTEAKSLPDLSPPAPGGAGTELKLLLSRFGIVARENCKCAQRAAEMDSNGPDWCKEHVEEIVDWLEEEANNRHMSLLFTRAVGRMLIRRAIKNARRKREMSGESR